MFAQAVDALVRQRDQQFLERIAADYSLDLAELQAKYTAVSEASVKVPRKYKKREPKEVKTTDEAGNQTKCQGITAKKEPCKFSALKGGCFCKRHQEQHDKKEGGAATATAAPAPTPAPVAPTAAETESRLAALLSEADSQVVMEECSECDSGSDTDSGSELGEGEEAYEDEE